MLFEKLINVVHEHAPQARLCFNQLPSDIAEAVKRWVRAGARGPIPGTCAEDMPGAAAEKSGLPMTIRPMLSRLRIHLARGVTQS